MFIRHLLSVSWFLSILHIFSSVQFSRSVVFNSLQPHELKHARPPCSSPTTRVHPNPCPSSWWCHPTISSSVVPFSSCLQSFPTSGSFQMNQFFSSGGQNIGVSASSVLPMNTQDWSPLGWTVTYITLYMDCYIYSFRMNVTYITSLNSYSYWKSTPFHR